MLLSLLLLPLLLLLYCTEAHILYGLSTIVYMTLASSGDEREENHVPRRSNNVHCVVDCLACCSDIFDPESFVLMKASLSIDGVM